MSYFQPYSYSTNKAEVGFDFSEHATKFDLKTQQV